MSRSLSRSLQVALALVALSYTTAPCQATPQATKPPAGVGEIRGRLLSAQFGRPIPGGAITVRHSKDSSFAGGALPRDDGSFRVDGLVQGRYFVRVLALGFAPVVRSDVSISTESALVDFGDLRLVTVARQLEAESVTAARDEVVLSPDRNSYSTKNMTTASGGTTIDVLRNIPMVEVDGSNKVSLRGSENVVVQINGRSSPLRGEQLGAFLAQLPASALKTVEVSTNPSAKNDPEGTAGIINIILNQEAEIGLSAALSASTGTTGMANVSGNVGRQSGPLTLFLSGSFYHDRRTISGVTTRSNLQAVSPAFLESYSDGTQLPSSGGLTLRSEYRLNSRDAVSFDAITYGGRYVNDYASYYAALAPSRAVIGLFDQFHNQSSRNASQDYSLAFRRAGSPTAASLSNEVRFSRSDNGTGAVLSQILLQQDASSDVTDVPRESDYTANGYPVWTWQTDYVRPYGKSTKLETGFKGIARSSANDFTPSYLDSSSGLFVSDAARRTLFDYREEIGAGYAVVSRQEGKAQFQGGLRLEQASTRLALPLISSRQVGAYGSAFPSAIAAYNFSPTRQVKLSYSRRISRPNPFQLSPVEYRQDARTVFRGNPDLGPEYTNAMELAVQEARSWGSVQLNPYVRYTSHAVRSIQLVDASGISLSTYDNVASTTNVGADLNVSYRQGPITLFGGGGAFRYSSDASNLSGNPSTQTVAWSVRTNVTWRYSDLGDLQFFGSYRAPSATEGGSQSSLVFINLATRYKFWGDQGNVSLRVADPFNQMKFGFRTNSALVIEDTQRRLGQRGVFITVSRTLGKQVQLRPKQTDSDSQGSPGQGPPGA